MPPCAIEKSANSFMSAPATKALSSAPVKTTTPTASFTSMFFKALCASSMVSLLRAFSCLGRLMVSMATPLEMSTEIFSNIGNEFCVKYNSNCA